MGVLLFALLWVVMFYCVQPMNTIMEIPSYQDIRTKCWLIIKILPQFPWRNDPFFATLTSQNESDKNQIRAMQVLLFNICMTRYQELMTQNEKFNALMQTNGSLHTHSSWLSQKKSLHILDLDETLIVSYIFLKIRLESESVLHNIISKGSKILSKRSVDPG